MLNLCNLFMLLGYYAFLMSSHNHNMIEKVLLTVIYGYKELSLIEIRLQLELRSAHSIIYNI